jgi:hypothetical protein
MANPASRMFSTSSSRPNGWNDMACRWWVTVPSDPSNRRTISAWQRWLKSVGIVQTYKEVHRTPPLLRTLPLGTMRGLSVYRSSQFRASTTNVPSGRRSSRKVLSAITMSDPLRRVDDRISETQHQVKRAANVTWKVVPIGFDYFDGNTRVRQTSTGLRDHTRATV